MMRRSGRAGADRRGRAAHGEPDPAWAGQGRARGGRRRQRRGRALDGAGPRVRRDRARRDAARGERFRDLSSPAEYRRVGAGAHADRARLGRGPGRWARHRRRRLSRETVCLRRAAGASARARASRRAGAAERARGGRPAARPGDAGGVAGRERDRIVDEGVRVAGDIHAPTRRGAFAPAPARARLGLRLRQPVQHRRRVRRAPAAKNRRAVRAQVARDGPRRRLPASCRRRNVSRVPIRVRVAAAFALAMAVVLAGTGWFLYARLGSHLALALDRELRLRAQDLAALVRERDGSLAAAGGGRLVERGESYAQLLADGHVVDGTRPLGRVSLLTVGELRNAREETFFSDRRSVPGLDEPSRLLATPIERRGRRLVLIVGATRQDRAETLASLRDELLIAGPLALALASLAGYFLAGLSLRPVESMRRRAATISAETPGERLPVPATRDELERLGDTLNAMLARLDAALQRERDFVADAGHELRTPLALLRTELELALRHGETIEELRDAVRRSSQEVDRLAQLAEDLLLTARAESGRVPLQRETLDVTELLAAVATRFSWRAGEAGRQITVEAAPDLW